MKKAAAILFIFLLITILTVNATALVKLKGYVNDYAKILGPQYETDINNLITETEKNTSAEIAVVTVTSLEGMAIEEYAVKLFEEESIGKKEKDNGLLLIIAPNERMYRVEVGYGLEGVIPDAYKVRIGTRILEPYFKQGKYGEGTYHAVKDIAALIQGETPDSTKPVKEIVIKDLIPALIIIIGLILIISMHISSARKNGYPIIFFPPIGGGGFSGGLGGSSGGFGGFGGGSSGGGGFSGRY